MRIYSTVLPLFCLGLFACQQQKTSELMAGKDVASYQKDAYGQFQVTCKNGLVEQREEYEILANQVCKTGYFMEVKSDLFLMSADGLGENCYLKTRDQPLYVSLDFAPSRSEEDLTLTLNSVPSSTQC